MNEALVKRALRSLDEMALALPSRGKVLILPHDHPDPDALASAAGLQLLLRKRFGLQGEIVFTGMASRAENVEMMRHFAYGWRSPATLKARRRPMPAVFVDSTPWSGNVTTPPFARPVVVIDHHPVRGRSRPAGLFADIRTAAGATATMVYQYLTAAAVAPPRWMATLFTYALLSETLDLSRDCSEEDLEAYVAMLGRANLRVLGRIRHAPLTREYFGHLKKATERARVFGRVAFSHLEAVSQSSMAAEVADLLLRLQGVRWAFCTAWCEGRLHISLRSSVSGCDCGRVVREQIGERGSGGGHRHMAAGVVNAAGLDATQRADLLSGLVAGLLQALEPRAFREAVREGKPLQPEPLVDAAVSPSAGPEERGFRS